MEERLLLDRVRVRGDGLPEDQGHQGAVAVLSDVTDSDPARSNQAPMGAGHTTNGAVGLGQTEDGRRGSPIGRIANWSERSHWDDSSQPMLVSSGSAAKGRKARGPSRYQPQTARSVTSIGTEYWAAKPSNVPPHD